MNDAGAVPLSKIRAMRVCEWEMRDAARRRGEGELARAHGDRAQMLTELLEAAPKQER